MTRTLDVRAGGGAGLGVVGVLGLPFAGGALGLNLSSGGGGIGVATALPFPLMSRFVRVGFLVDPANLNVHPYNEIYPL